MLHRNPSCCLLGSIALTCLLNACLTAAGAEELLPPTKEARIGRLTRVTAQLDVRGNLTVRQGAKLEEIPLSVAGKLVYDERVLALDGDKCRSLRNYEHSKADIHIDRVTITPSLRPECCLIGADFDGSAITLFCPRTPLSRDELDLIDFPGSSLLIDELLPAEPAKQGGTWQQSDGLWAGLLRLDAVAANDIKCTLKEIAPGKTATVEFNGHVDGAVDGVTTEVDVTGSYQVDLVQQRITVFDLKIKEKRSISPIGPGLNVTANLHLDIAALTASPALADDALKDLPLDLKAAGDRLAHVGVAKNHRLLHPRSWHVMDERPEMTVLRMVDRGELVAQCNIATPPAAKGKEPPSLEQFQKEVEKSLGENMGQVLQFASSTNARGYVVQRVVVAGQVMELPIEWRYYLVANQHGRQVVLAFTMEQSLVERLADSDQEIVSSIEFLDTPVKAASLPTNTK